MYLLLSARVAGQKGVARHSAPTAPKVTREIKPLSNYANQIRKSRARAVVGVCVPPCLYRLL